MVNWDNFASPRIAAEKTGYSKSHVRNLADWGFIEASKISGRWIVYIPSLISWRDRKLQQIPA